MPKLELPPESPVPARERVRLIQQTHRVIGSIAAQGIRALGKLPPDEGFPIVAEAAQGVRSSLPVRQYGVMRRVTPPPDAETDIRGYNLAVAAAHAGFTQRRLPFNGFAGRAGILPNQAGIPLPLSRGRQELTVDFTRKPSMPGCTNPDVTISLAQTGEVVPRITPPDRFVDMRLFAAARSAAVATEVTGSDARYTEPLVLGSLAAHALLAYGITVDTEPAEDVLNEWRAFHYLSTITDDMWLHTIDPELRLLQDSLDA